MRVGVASTFGPGPGPLFVTRAQSLAGTHTGLLAGRVEFQGEIVTEQKVSGKPRPRTRARLRVYS